MINFILRAASILAFLAGLCVGENTNGFATTCAYQGVNLTDGHWLGSYCRNHLRTVFGYNYTW
jgi:hypothetical protein